MIIPILLLLTSSCMFSQADWQYIPFDTAMREPEYPQAILTTESIVGINGNILYNFFKNLYETNCTYLNNSESELKIPKIIHQIWLGSEVPELFEKLQQTWIQQHMGRDWLYKLWTDADVAQMQLYNQEFYDATDNYGTKSDILRWELLYHFGGVYVDMDFECLQALDQFHYTYDFYTGLQPLDTLFVQLGAALVGSIPGHPILQHCIETIKYDWHHHGAPKKTGPVHFTKSFYLCAGMNENKDIALPAFYFYPLGCRETNIDVNEWIKHGAYAVHWWAKSWMPKNYRPSISQNIHNDTSVINWNS